MSRGNLIRGTAALIIAALGLAPAAAAQTAAPNPGTGGPLAAGAPEHAAQPDLAARVAELSRQLVSAQQEIVRLRAEADTGKQADAALAQCRDKNGRLVSITNDLIAAYDKRYRRGQFLPFDTGRRRFEAELQTIGDEVYRNRADANTQSPAVRGIGAAVTNGAEETASDER